MNAIYTLFLILVTMTIQSAFYSGALASGAGWQLVWSDEFVQEGAPDPQKWAYDLGTGEAFGLVGWGNNEAQFYTNRPENVRVEGGRLIIEARREPMGAAQYTSARLVTRNLGDWTYGRIEVRAKMPRGRGTWPAIWMLPTDRVYGGWPASGEIDIMEHVGHDHGRIHGTIHTSAFNHMQGTQRGGTVMRPDLDSNFYTYAIEWEEERIRWLIDDEVYFVFERQPGWGSAQWPFDQRFHLILNIAIGGSWGGQQGIDTSVFPQTMEVEYVRVYQRVQETDPQPQTPDGVWIYLLKP